MGLGGMSGGDVASVKAQLNNVLDNLESVTAGLQMALERAQSAAGGLHLVMEGTGRQDMTDAAQTVAEMVMDFEERLGHAAWASEQIRTYMQML